MSPAESEVVEMLTDPLLVTPLMQVPEVEVSAQATPDAVASAADSKPVLFAPPFGEYFPI